MDEPGEVTAPPIATKPLLWPHEAMKLDDKGADGACIQSRSIIPPTPGGWQVAMFEWALTRSRWTDEHHHIEVNLVVEGELHVDCNGQELVAKVGDSISVPPGSRASYYAPVYARMVGCYGPNAGVKDTFGQREPL